MLIVLASDGFASKPSCCGCCNCVGLRALSHISAIFPGLWSIKACAQSPSTDSSLSRRDAREIAREHEIFFIKAAYSVTSQAGCRHGTSSPSFNHVSRLHSLRYDMVPYSGTFPYTHWALRSDCWSSVPRCFYPALSTRGCFNLCLVPCRSGNPPQSLVDHAVIY